MSPTQVDQLLQLLNDAWLSQDYVALSRLYHPDVVLLPPDAGEPIEGSAAVIDAYKDFHAACRVESFAITEARSWEFAATTLVHMRFAIDYTLGADAPPQSEQGLEVYTITEANSAADTDSAAASNFDATNGAPQIVWRAQFTL